MHQYSRDIFKYGGEDIKNNVSSFASPYLKRLGQQYNFSKTE